MFGWLKSKAGKSFFKSDTEKTLRGVLEMPENTQRTIALEVLGEIIRATREIQKTPGPSSPERDEVMKDQMKRAKARRHLALKQGASDYTDPIWATAALIEGWLITNSGTMGRDAFDQVNGLIMGWARSVLTDADFEMLETLEAEAAS